MSTSYSSKTHGLRRRLQEARVLYRMWTRAASDPIQQLIDEARKFERIVEDLYGAPFERRVVLEVGPGFCLAQAHYYALHNEVTAIDTDVIPMGFSPRQYFSMLVQNGARRTAKTIARKILGIDAQKNRKLKGLLGLSKLPALRVLHGDACNMEFADCSFDVVLCRSVLHHIPNPAVALREMGRVLRPGGVAIANFHLYSSHNGSLDPRVMSRNYDNAFLWAHLRPGMAESFRGNAYLNKLRLHEWRAVLSSSWPGSIIECESSSRPRVLESAQEMVSAGMISGYTVEELTTHTVMAVWQKASKLDFGKRYSTKQFNEDFLVAGRAGRA